MVQPPICPNPPSQPLPASTSLQQANAKPPPLPRHRLRTLHGYLLALYPAAADRVEHVKGPGGTFLLASRVGAGYLDAG